MTTAAPPRGRYSAHSMQLEREAWCGRRRGEAKPHGRRRPPTPCHREGVPNPSSREWVENSETQTRTEAAVELRI